MNNPRSIGDTPDLCKGDGPPELQDRKRKALIKKLETEMPDDMGEEVAEARRDYMRCLGLKKEEDHSK